MSGPVTEADTPATVAVDHTTTASGVEVLESRDTQVGNLRVRRALPRRAHRTVGAWCFADHAGPVAVDESDPVDIGPHPHMGLQTVTWLLAGELVHHDSLGSEQVIRPGQLNLMTAGNGVAHAEETMGGYHGEFHGIQLWVAQPNKTRHGDAAFEHHADMPKIEFGDALATVIVGEFDGVSSPARRDTDHSGVELALRPGRTVVPVRREYEHGLIVFSGALSLGTNLLEPGHIGYLGVGRDEVVVDAPGATRALLLGGVPFPEPILMWWNFVGRSKDEMDAAHDQWQAADPRFGVVASPLERVPAPRPHWARQR
jgi:redox-sensitive bicupin YhaK (pirin superfamily)